MKAVDYRRNLPIDDPDALIDVDLPEPTPGPRGQPQTGARPDRDRPIAGQGGARRVPDGDRHRLVDQELVQAVAGPDPVGEGILVEPIGVAVAVAVRFLEVASCP